jgi:hypothetical protein
MIVAKLDTLSSASSLPLIMSKPRIKASLLAEVSIKGADKFILL